MSCPHNPGLRFRTFEPLPRGIEELWEAKTYLADLRIDKTKWLSYFNSFRGFSRRLTQKSEKSLFFYSGGGAPQARGRDN